MISSFNCNSHPLTLSPHGAVYYQVAQAASSDLCSGGKFNHHHAINSLTLIGSGLGKTRYSLAVLIRSM